jgi:monoamine oxidase
MINLPLAFYSALIDKTQDVYGNVGKEELGKVTFKMGFPVDGIYYPPEGEGIVLQYRNESSYESLFEKFDYVVCTIPFSSLRRVRINPLFSVMKMQAISELNYEIGQKTFLFLNERFWEMGPPDSRIAGGSTSTDLPVIASYYPSDHAVPIPGVFNGWTLRPGTSPFEPGVLLASYNWSQDATRLGNEYDRLRICDISRYIEEVHGLPPGYIQSRLISYKSILWSRAQYIWTGACLTKPEDKVLFSYIITLPEMNGRVFFAGEHISQKHAWQQGALQTGMIAANDVAKSIKYKKS